MGGHRRARALRVHDHRNNRADHPVLPPRVHHHRRNRCTVLTGTAADPAELRRVLDRLDARGTPALDIRISNHDDPAAERGRATAMKLKPAEAGQRTARRPHVKHCAAGDRCERVGPAAVMCVWPSPRDSWYPPRDRTRDPPRRSRSAGRRGQRGPACASRPSHGGGGWPPVRRSAAWGGNPESGVIHGERQAHRHCAWTRWRSSVISCTACDMVSAFLGSSWWWLLVLPGLPTFVVPGCARADGILRLRFCLLPADGGEPASLTRLGGSQTT